MTRRPVTASDLGAGPHIPGYDEFEIDFEDILRTTLPPLFESIPPARLTSEAVSALPLRAKGAYLLLLDDRPVYAGKTDTRHGFRDRLRRHASSVQHRVGLDPERISFKAVRIMVFSAFDVEAILIAKLRGNDSKALPWNDSGFGSNDPGRRRDGQQPAPFDRDFPIDVDRPLDMHLGPCSAGEALGHLNEVVPYLLRVGPDSEIQATDVEMPANPTMRSALRAILSYLSPGWQATVFHGRVIMYRQKTNYPFAREILSSRSD